MERERWLDWATGKALSGLMEFGHFHVRHRELADRVMQIARERGTFVKITPLLGAWRLEVIAGDAHGEERTG